jgi:hypothetical protein
VDFSFHGLLLKASLAAGQATNEWEEGITDLISANAEMAAKIREFEDNYDNDLLDLNEVV